MFSKLVVTEHAKRVGVQRLDDGGVSVFLEEMSSVGEWSTIAASTMSCEQAADIAIALIEAQR